MVLHTSMLGMSGTGFCYVDLALWYYIAGSHDGLEIWNSVFQGKAHGGLRKQIKKFSFLLLSLYAFFERLFLQEAEACLLDISISPINL